MEVYVFENRDLRVEVVWDKDRAAEIRLGVPKSPVINQNPPPQVEKFFDDLKRYLEGERVAFTLPLDLNRLSDFARKVSAELVKTKRGEVLSYRELASRAGNPGASRAVGGVMARNPFPLVIPCHRVLGSDGSLTGFSAGLDIKRRLLVLEGGDRELA